MIEVAALLVLLNGQAADARAILTSQYEFASTGIIRFLYDLGWAMAYAESGSKQEMSRYLTSALRYALQIEGEGLISCCLIVGAFLVNLSGDPQYAAKLVTLQHPMNRWLQAWPMLKAVHDAEQSTGNPTPVSMTQEAARLMKYLFASGDQAQLTAQRLAANQSLVEPLSTREIEVLALIAQGLSNQEISEILTVELGTVKKHITNVYGKLDVSSRTQAILRAREIGLVV